MKRLLQWWIIVCLCLTFAISPGVLRVWGFAENVDGEETTQRDPITIGTDRTNTGKEESPNSVGDWASRLANYFNWAWNPQEGFVYNQRYAWQWVLGFNEFYDTFAFAAGVFADTLKLKFTYEEKDWLIQLWKGAYGVGLIGGYGGYGGYTYAGGYGGAPVAVGGVLSNVLGGEIGVYTKKAGQKLNHYYGAVYEDWLNMRMWMYNRGAGRVVQVPVPDIDKDPDPMELKWWCSGYGGSIVTDWNKKPRRNVVMDARIELKTPEMAALFVQQLEEKGFLSFEPDLFYDVVQLSDQTPERYLLEEDRTTVHFVWRDSTENWY